jgi:hypothetical protein
VLIYCVGSHLEFQAEIINNYVVHRTIIHVLLISDNLHTFQEDDIFDLIQAWIQRKTTHHYFSINFAMLI